MDVPDLAIPPRREHPFGVGHHRFAVGAGAPPPMMEGRLSEAPLTPPELAFAIEKTLAEEAQLPTEVPALYEVAVVLD